MMTLLALAALVACEGGTTSEDSGLPPDVFAAIITSHVDGDKLLEGYRVGLAGKVSDPDGVNSDVAVTWTVGDDEACPETTAADDGTTSCDVVFDSGEVVVVLEARAPDGETTQATVTFDVTATQPPTAAISEPADGSSVFNDPGVYMAGTVADAEDAASALLYTWSSSVQGPLVGSTPPTDDGLAEALTVLEAGTHTLTLDVIDATGKSDSASVSVTVE